MAQKGKLVRNRIPEIIRASGRTPAVRRLSRQERLPALFDKLQEEADELRAAATPDDRAEELADVYEVLLGIAADLGIPWGDLDRLAAAKRAERGGFDQGFYLTLQ